MTEENDNSDGESNTEALGSTADGDFVEITGGKTKSEIKKGKTGDNDGGEGGYGFIRPSAESTDAADNSESEGNSDSD